MTIDMRGTPVSCESRPALDRYEEALHQLQAFDGDPVATIERALVDDPAFVLGHVLRAGTLMTLTERRFETGARESVAAAEALLSGANDRERGLVAATRRLVDGDWAGACAVFDRVLVDHPRDALALQVAHLFDFYRGDALNLRNRVGRVLAHWSPDVPGYSFVLGMYAFGLEECNQYADAEDAARRALALEPRDPWAVHAATHVMEMQGRVEEGIAWLTSRETHWGRSSLAPHEHWHLALFHLDRGEFARALAVYDRGILPAPSDLALQLLDCSALLWRLTLERVDVGRRFEALADAWQAVIEAEGGYYAFNDCHAVMAFIATGREAEVTRLVARMESAARRDSLAASMMRRVGLPLARGLIAFGRGRHDEVLDHLVPIRDDASHFGGSHAQRDLITLTLVESALRGNRHALARHLLADRNVQRPSSALGWRLRARAPS